MSLTAGYPSPNSLTLNLDTMMTLAFANAGPEIFDTVSKNLALFYEIKKNGMYEPVAKMKPQIIVPLMYGLGNAEWYEGWDVLGTQPTEGITDAVYEWRQLACPTGYNRREQRLTDESEIKQLIKVKIEQTKLTMPDVFDKALLQGNLNSPGGKVYDAVVSTTGRSGIEPLPKLIYYDTSITAGTPGQPSGSLTVGGLDQSLTVNSNWRNWSLDCNATTYIGLLAQFDLMFNRCSRGVGGSPNLIVTDDTTRSLLNTAYFDKYRTYMKEDGNFPFDNLLFHNAHVVVDEYVPDVENNLTNTDTKGTAYFINSNFLKVKYDPETNFTLTDFQKPVNQDGKIAHSLWMGNVVCTNRRKHGVIGDIARTLTVS